MSKTSWQELCRAYDVMGYALGRRVHTRIYLMRYLDGVLLPSAIRWSRGQEVSWFWMDLTDETRQKLEALLGPHGHTIAMAFIARNPFPWGH